MARAKIGIFGGSFDPPHHGHIHIILSLKEYHALDEVWVVPACKNPLKSSSAPPEDRLEMSRLAFGDLPGCQVLDVDLARPPPSYMIDTLTILMALHQEFREAERFLLFGADLLDSLPVWRDVDTVFRISRPLVAARGPVVFGARKEIEEGWTNVGLLDISSTMVRSRLSRGLYVNHLVPASVVRYSTEKNLYERLQ